MPYAPTVWVNGGLPAINATNLGHIESGLETVAEQTDAQLSGMFYAELYAGASDDVKAQAALTACYAAGGGTVMLPAGSLTWTTAPLQLLPNVSARVKIRGAEEGTTVTLTSGCRRFADFARSANGDTFTDITVSDVVVDADSIGGKHHVIVGNCINFAAATARKVNFDNIRVERCRAINVPVGTDDNTDLRVGIAIQSWNNGDTPDAQNTISNVWIDDVHIEGGLVGIQIAGFPDGVGVLSANVWIDNVHVRGGSHICSVPTQTGAGNHILLGNKGWGNYATISGFKGVGCSDCGIEVNAMQSFVGSNIYIENAWNHCYFNTNYHAPSNATSQLHRWISCTAVRTSAHTHDTADGIHYATKSPAGNYPSNVDLAGFRWEDNSTLFDGSGGDGVHFSGPPRATIRDFLGYRNHGTYSGASDAVSSMVWCDSLDIFHTSRVVLDNVRLKVVGTKTGVGTVTNYGVRIGRAGITDFKLSDVEVDITSTDTITYGLALGALTVNPSDSSFPTIRGTVDKYSFASANAATVSGIHIPGTGTTTITDAVTILDPDFTRGQAATVDVDFAGTSNAAKTHIIRPRWRVAKTPSAITVGASPYSYTNLDGYTERVVVRGGTVSLVEVAADGSNFESTGVTAGVFLVEPGAVLKVTYSVTPTMRKIPPNATGAV